MLYPDMMNIKKQMATDRDDENLRPVIGKSTTESVAYAEGVTTREKEALRDGDYDIFRKLYLGYVDTLVRFLQPLVGTREDAEEVAQDVFLRLWENRAQIDPERNIRSYIFAWSRNLAIDRIRHRAVEERNHEVLRYLISDLDEATPEEVVMEKETELLVRICVEKMPARQREVFLLSREERMSDDEIAARLNVSKRTVQTHLYNARKALREALKFLPLILFF